MNITQLEELGLTRNEAVTYKALLETGETKTGAIVKITSMHRVLIYDALDSLIKKGLASYVIKENIKYFQASDPSRLLDFIEEKKSLAKKILPELELLKQSQSKQSVSIYEGIKGLKSAMNDMLKELTDKDYHYVFGSGDMAPNMGSYYDIFQDIKRKKGIMTKAICDVSYGSKKEIIQRTFATIKLYPLTPFQTDTWIYKDKVLMVTYSAKPPLAIQITSKETAQSYKKIFESLWKKAKSLKTVN